MEQTLKWKRDGRGRQISTDGRFACQHDGYDAIKSVGAEEGTGYEGFQGGEWAAILIETDDNLDWYPTLREAKERCEDYARWGR